MEPKIYSSADHHIRNDHINPNALSVLKRLHEAGYTAYLVGGGVRDLLMRKHPKDFDISTSATPEEIKSLFKNCILIGRRFRLAHIRFGREIIEVATFRTGESSDELILKDNVWGSPEEDVLRRDFTINGLFYDPLDHKIIDFVGGFEDLQKHLLRSIGDPLIRFKQDPVRMIRMQKFKARFGFHIDPESKNAAERCKQEIMKSSPARVLEEIFRMLESGASSPFFSNLYDSELLSFLFPALNALFENEVMRTKILTSLKTADEMNHKGHYRPLERSILVSALVYPVLEEVVASHLKNKDSKPPHMGQIIDLIHVLIEDLFVRAFIHFPKKIRFETHFILQMQYRLTPLDKRKRPSTKLVKQKHFELALIFLKFRALTHPSLFKTYEHWKHHYKEVDEVK